MYQNPYHGSYYHRLGNRNSAELQFDLKGLEQFISIRHSGIQFIKANIVALHNKTYVQFIGTCIISGGECSNSTGLFSCMEHIDCDIEHIANS